MSASPIKSQAFNIAGLKVHTYSTTPAPSPPPQLTDVVFLLHGRMLSHAMMTQTAERILQRSNSPPTATPSRGLVVVNFDQRNHGHRKVTEEANLAWADGNERHGQDMFSIYYGTSQDVSLLITFLPVYLFPQGESRIGSVICAGVSLGGHAVYQVLSNDPRVAAGVVVIGCPDFLALMSARAGPEKLHLRMPPTFVELLEKLAPNPAELAKKDILILKGDEDRLVPWEASQEVVENLRKNSKGQVEVVGYPGVGHAYPDAMVEKVADWVRDWRERH